MLQRCSSVHTSAAVPVPPARPASLGQCRIADGVRQQLLPAAASSYECPCTQALCQLQRRGLLALLCHSQTGPVPACVHMLKQVMLMRTDYRLHQQLFHMRHMFRACWRAALSSPCRLASIMLEDWLYGAYRSFAAVLRTAVGCTSSEGLAHWLPVRTLPCSMYLWLRR